MKFCILIALACAAMLCGESIAADFGPSPYTTNDPSLVVTYVGANTTTGALNMTVNGVNYSGTVSYVYLYNIAAVQYYSSVPAVLVSADGRVISASVYATHWTTRQSSGRGGGYLTQHYAVVGGSVTP